ncbi:hypothetical protein TSMEX_006234 [Taenia solium]|eukprot:TsM_001039000 transcript=TsM_001039000 gene=TsM_001039000
MHFEGKRREDNPNLVADGRASSREEEEREDPSTLVEALPQRQRVSLIFRALPQETFLAAINAGATAEYDIDHCCEMLPQLTIDYREQSLAIEFFHLDRKAVENDEKVTNWVAVQFRAGVRPLTIAAKLHALKINDLNQLVETATRNCQKLLLTPTSQTSNRRPNPARPCWTPSSRIPRAGEPYYFLSCLPPNGSCLFLQVPGKLEECPAVFSLVNLQAFPILRSKFCAGPFLYKKETSLKVSVRKETRMVQFIVSRIGMGDMVLAVDFLHRTKAILNFAEGTFTAQQHEETNSVISPLEKDADEICSALFEAAGIAVNKLDGLRSQLTQITDSGRKELHSLLSRCSNSLAWRGTKLGRTSIVNHYHPHG